MLEIKTLVPQLQKQVLLLTEDLLAQSNSVPEIGNLLRDSFAKMRESGGLSQSYEEWSGDNLEQVAVSWVLACVFVRFLEDNRLIDECWIAGDGDRGTLADGSYEIYFRNHPNETDREYLKFVFREVGKIPAASELFDEERVRLWAVNPSGDAARKLLHFFKEIDAEAGGLKRQFDTREIRTKALVDVYEELAPQAQFLGDLYQDLSEHARKKYALLQTPEFVQQFILDRTLTPAIDEFGLKGLRIIDPACGSGHFLLGAFDRLFALWMKSDDIKGNPVVAAQNAFDSIFGVDVNPFAIAITRFRMLVAAVRACGINRLHQQSYAWKLNLAVGDSLLRGSKPTFREERVRILTQQELDWELARQLRIEDPKPANEILDQGFHVVVGNPPYITVKDKVQNDSYRQVYSTCHRQYSLGVPFTQRFWDLAIRKGECVRPDTADVCPTAGYIGMITASSFMKREFGKKLIEEFIPKSDLTHVVDTSGAYIPGHGTPTVILLGRSRRPVGTTVRAILGIKGEPSAPDDPAQGLVWQSILRQLDVANAQDEFTSTADVPRETFAKHPWSIGGGGAADVKEQLEEACETSLGDKAAAIGFMCITKQDDVFPQPREVLSRNKCEDEYLRPFGIGEDFRDWEQAAGEWVIYPYDRTVKTVPPEVIPRILRFMWPYKSVLEDRKVFGGQTYSQVGKPWYEYGQIPPDRQSTALSLAFAFVATHNHFVLDRGGKMFKQSAPIIKLHADATEDDHLSLLGLLNSSTACFWMKQVSHCMGSTVDQRGARQRTDPFEDFYQFNGTQVGTIPLAGITPLSLSRRLDQIAKELGELSTDHVLNGWAKGNNLQGLIEESEAKAGRFRGLMLVLQEELDWQCYNLYGLLADDLCYTGDDLPRLALGERAFEIVLARSGAPTTWFDRHGSTPISEIPAHWPAPYRALVERRIKLIETNKEIGLIEKPEYKRRWNTEPWAEQQERALKNWLLDRLESPRYWPTVEWQSTARLADRASADPEFLDVATLFRGRLDFDMAALVAELVEGESVPFLPVLRYKASGLRKRAVWERTWELQRREDAGESVGEIAVPPKYTSADFLKSDFWRLRGKLDVPKERWVSYPHCNTDGDPTLHVAWAGWNHLQQVEALVGYYDARKREGWDAKRLVPLLAGIDQLLPWVHQWHPEVLEEFGESAGESYQKLLNDDAHELGLTLDVIRNWTPPPKTRGRGRRPPPPESEDDE